VSEPKAGPVLYVLITSIDEVGKKMVEALLKEPRIKIVPYTFDNHRSAPEIVVAGEFFQTARIDQIGLITTEFPELVIVDNLKEDFAVSLAFVKRRIPCIRTRNPNCILDQIHSYLP